MEDIKILIAGSGVAGLTLAGLLIQKGIVPTIIEKESAEEFNKTGYMLGLLPLGGRVLNSLDLKESYYNESVQMNTYEIHDSNGNLIKSFPLDFINNNYGSYRGIQRNNLIKILMSKIEKNKIIFGEKIRSIKHLNGSNEVTFTNNFSDKFDLVVIAEGMHSETRKLILKHSEYNYLETNWGGWVTWLDEKPISSYKEYWGAGSFLGLYPVKEKIGVFLGGPVSKTNEKGVIDFVKELQNNIANNNSLLHNALDSFKDKQNLYFWNFHDFRSKIWKKDNIILLGDAATGFLPTAGVGASMAMDSAAVLADELSRADKGHLSFSLDLYCRKQKQRVEKAQDDSRKFGQWMFMKSRIMTKLRNNILPFYSLDKMLSDLSNVMEGE